MWLWSAWEPGLHVRGSQSHRILRISVSLWTDWLATNCTAFHSGSFFSALLCPVSFVLMFSPTLCCQTSHSCGFYWLWYDLFLSFFNDAVLCARTERYDDNYENKIRKRKHSWRSYIIFELLDSVRKNTWTGFGPAGRDSGFVRVFHEHVADLVSSFMRLVHGLFIDAIWAAETICFLIRLRLFKVPTLERSWQAAVA